ncbi:MAG: hypothetical protein E7579_04385 [Ruminococcaceae bacterium]|nr:hypothetical protein [Oscillospiraceae bacterium]
MTKDEVMYAAKERKPVVCNGIRYRRISAIIFRYIGDTDRIGMAHNVPNEMMLVELEDLHTNSRTIANPSAVELGRW